MPRTIPAALLAKIQSDDAALCTIATITRRDGVILRLTDLDKSFKVGGELYIASEGYDRKSIEHRAGTKVDETEMTALFGSSQINVTDLANGLYSYADVHLEGIDFTDVSLGKFTLSRGRVGKIVRGDTGGFKFDLRSITERLIGKLGRTVTPECLWSIGDTRCRIPILPDLAQRNTAYILGDFVRAVVAGGNDFEVYGNIIFECIVAGTSDGSEPTWDTDLGDSTTDGTVTWKTHTAWSRDGVVATTIDVSSFTATITESRAVDDWFTLGAVFFLSGDNVTGRPHEVQSWVQTGGTITLALPVFNDIQVGDRFRIFPGCDLTRRNHCALKFVMPGSISFVNGNAKRFGGFDSLPGRQFLHQNVHAGK